MTGEMLVIALFYLYKTYKNIKFSVNGIDKCYNHNERKIKFV